jgi:prophage regulatory protein
MRVVSYRELKSKYGIKYTQVHLRRLEEREKFPRRIKIGAGRAAWLEDEIDKWLLQCVAERDQRHGVSGEKAPPRNEGVAAA